MKMVFKVIFIFMLLFFIFVSFSFLFSWLFLSVNHGEKYYVSSFFRQSRFYYKGIHFLPEKILLFLDSDFFQIRKLDDAPFYYIEDNIDLFLPKINMASGDEYKLSYLIGLNYSLSEKKQLFIASKNLEMDFHVIFKNEIVEISKSFVYENLIRVLNLASEIDLLDILIKSNDRILRFIKARYGKDVFIDSFENNVIFRPNFDLYRKSKEIFLKLNEKLILDNIEKTNIQKNLNDKITRLKKYGELLKEYPEVLHLIYIDRLGNGRYNEFINPDNISNRVDDIKKSIKNRNLKK